MLEKRYDPRLVEEGKYAKWKKEGYFTAGDKTKAPFSIVIPPPNVTGKLHLGHAWDTTIQDIIARYKKMQGFDVCYLPGMDHAGIATQAKVMEKLVKNGVDVTKLTREEFLESAWSWKHEYAENIRQQWAKMGLALDYTRERFTLDEGLNYAVRTVFVNMYNKGLIYQGEKIINWDPVQKTALSNIEVIHQDDKGYMYYFLYPIVGTNESLTVATTRPETLFGDTAVYNRDFENTVKLDFKAGELSGGNIFCEGANILIRRASDFSPRLIVCNALKDIVGFLWQDYIYARVEGYIVRSKIF